MEKLIPLCTYIGVFTLFFLSFLLVLLKKTNLEKITGIFGCFLCGAGILSMIIIEKRPPLFGTFESTIYIIFILSLFVLLPGHSLLSGLSKNNIPGTTYITILFILLLQAGEPMVFNNDFYMYDDLIVIVFFNFRLIAAAFFIYAAIIVNSCIWRSNARIKNSGKDLLMKNSRNFLLAGVAIYLVSEWAGSIWCLNWLGDTWLWSKGFFKSSIIFLLVMIISHLPSSHSKFYRTKAILSSFPAIFILWMIFHH